jgi:peptidyl-tRNA hydrolase
VGRPAGSAGDVIDFVLAPFDEDELAEIGARVEAAVNALETFLLDGIGSAMERFNPLP